jgi:hypothetical protein
LDFHEQTPYTMRLAPLDCFPPSILLWFAEMCCRWLKLQKEIRITIHPSIHTISDRKPGEPKFCENSAMIFEVSPAYQALLTTHGLDSISKILNHESGVKMREVPGRLTVKLELAAGCTLYLKRHFPPARKAERAGIKEWDNIHILSALGIRCPEPVAAGCGHLAGQSGSFLITAAVPEGLPLDEVLRQRFRGKLSSADLHRKREFITKLAAFVRQFHDTGFHHKDFYLCHLFVSPAQDREERLWLIDLQRLGRSWMWRRRWVVKDLAALNYSATADFTRSTDRLRFVLNYLGIGRLTPASKRLIRSILRKTERIRRHDANLQRRAGLSPGLNHGHDH